MVSDPNVSLKIPLIESKMRFDGLLTIDSSRDSSIAPYSISGHGHDDTMANDGYGGHNGDMYDDNQPPQTNMTKLQIFMSRSLGGWPLYTIIISLGQLLSAVCPLHFSS